MSIYKFLLENKDYFKQFTEPFGSIEKFYSKLTKQVGQKIGYKNLQQFDKDFANKLIKNSKIKRGGVLENRYYVHSVGKYENSYFMIFETEYGDFIAISPKYKEIILIDSIKGAPIKKYSADEFKKLLDNDVDINKDIFKKNEDSIKPLWALFDGDYDKVEKKLRLLLGNLDNINPSDQYLLSYKFPRIGKNDLYEDYLGYKKEPANKKTDYRMIDYLTFDKKNKDIKQSAITEVKIKNAVVNVENRLILDKFGRAFLPFDLEEPLFVNNLPQNLRGLIDILKGKYDTKDVNDFLKNILSNTDIIPASDQKNKPDDDIDQKTLISDYYFDRNKVYKVNKSFVKFLNAIYERKIHNITEAEQKNMNLENRMLGVFKNQYKDSKSKNFGVFIGNIYYTMNVKHKQTSDNLIKLDRKNLYKLYQNVKDTRDFTNIKFLQNIKDNKLCG